MEQFNLFSFMTQFKEKFTGRNTFPHTVPAHERSGHIQNWVIGLGRIFKLAGQTALRPYTLPLDSRVPAAVLHALAVGRTSLRVVPTCANPVGLNCQGCIRRYMHLHSDGGS